MNAWVCVCVHACVCSPVHVRMYVCVRVCMHVCLRVCASAQLHEQKDKDSGLFSYCCRHFLHVMCLPCCSASGE